MEIYNHKQTSSDCLPSADPSFGCDDGRAILIQGMHGQYCNTSGSVTGILSVCVNQEYVPVCSSGIDLQDAQSYCEKYEDHEGYPTGEYKITFPSCILSVL